MKSAETKVRIRSAAAAISYGLSELAVGIILGIPQGFDHTGVGLQSLQCGIEEALDLLVPEDVT